MTVVLIVGLLLGAGFIISGYCPGTSAVAAASGNLDGAFTFLGVMAGSALYAEAYPLLGKLALWLTISPTKTCFSGLGA